MPEWRQPNDMHPYDLGLLDRTGLTDIHNIQIDTSLTPEQRMILYSEQAKNPYLFLCGDTAVHIRFDPTGDALINKLRNYYVSRKKN